jgi:gamma-glutamylaminecyclotransferase
MAWPGGTWGWVALGGSAADGGAWAALALGAGGCSAGFFLQPVPGTTQSAAAESNSAVRPEPVADFPRMKPRDQASLQNSAWQRIGAACGLVRRAPTPAKRHSMLLFAYGTLRRGQSNHSRLADARFVAEARTEPSFELVDLGGYPALLEGGDTAVSGELYELDAALLARLDEFEEVPQLYERKQISLGDTCAHVYVMPRDRAACAPRIQVGDWCADALQTCS